MSRVSRFGVGVLLALWSVAAFGSGYLLRAAVVPVEYRVERIYGAGNDHALLDEAWAYVESHFVGDLPDATAREYGAIRGALSTLNDPYTSFVEPAPRAVERDHMRGVFGGIGVQLRLTPEGRIALSPTPDGPAERAGVREGDLLVAVDGVPLPFPASIEDAMRLRGEEGTVVVIEVLRGSQRLKFAITRERIELPSVEHRIITTTAAALPIGYVAIRGFTERTAAQLEAALRALAQAGVQGYVLDLRDNAGGLLNAAVEVTSFFLRDRVVAYEVRRNQAEIVHRTRSVSHALPETQPLVVLVNGGTASAAEVVAAALRDHQRAVLVGQKTLGKGSVQFVFELRDGSAVRVTAARWLTARREQLDGKGLNPDVLAEDDAESQLQTALRTLIARLRLGVKEARSSS
ncbi:MAG: S41 family peptidase [Thermoflexales bacterium]|nr:S41 family peptidase [Thermoflexales bacterium]